MTRALRDAATRSCRVRCATDATDVTDATDATDATDVPHATTRLGAP